MTEFARASLLTPEKALELGMYSRELPPPPAGLSTVETDLLERGYTLAPPPQKADIYPGFIELAAKVLEDEDCVAVLEKLYFPDQDGRRKVFAGLIRKELEIKDGRQVADPKTLFQFSPQANEYWRRFYGLNKDVDNFLEQGATILEFGLKSLKRVVGHLEPTHPGITDLHFPENCAPTASLRLVRYDGYEASAVNAGKLEEGNLVAAMHADKGSFTAQLYATDEGLQLETPTGEIVDAPPRNGLVYVFGGLALRRLYGDCSRLPATSHWVVRSSQTEGNVNPRYALILFSDTSGVDANADYSESHLLQ